MITINVQKRQCGNDSNRFDGENKAVVAKQLKSEYITKT